MEITDIKIDNAEGEQPTTVQRLVDRLSTNGRPEPETALRRSITIIRTPRTYSPSTNYLHLTENDEPQFHFGVVEVEDSAQRECIMKEEMASLENNKIWSISKLPSRKKVLQNKWIIRVKDEAMETCDISYLEY